jgi:hypothetical protein
MMVRRLLTLLCALALAAGVAACGNHHPHLAGGQAQGTDAADANNNGGYVDAGPVTYQLEISRPLNQYSTEDSQYVRGLPAGMSSDIPGTQLWYGVFLWAKNQTQHPQSTTDNFEIVDTQGNVYHPVKLDPAVNPLAWNSESLAPLQTEPKPGTLMSEDSPGGGELLFKVSNSVFDNRPLTLYILGSNDQKLGSISLNL